MPCMSFYDDIPSEKIHSTDDANDSKTIKSLKSELSKLGSKYSSLKKECDKVTQLLCYSCGIFREHRGIATDDRLIDWMIEHNHLDAKRTLETFKSTWPSGDVSKEDARNYFISEAEKVHPLSNWHRTKFFDAIWDKFEKDMSKINELAQLKKRVAELEAEINNDINEKAK